MKNYDTMPESNGIEKDKKDNIEKDQDAMGGSKERVIEALRKKSKERGTDINDYLEKIDKEDDDVKVIMLITEAISKI